MADNSCSSSTSHVCYNIFCLGSFWRGCKSFLFNCYRRTPPSSNNHLRCRRHANNNNRVNKALDQQTKKSNKEEARNSPYLRFNGDIDEELERRVVTPQRKNNHHKFFKCSLKPSRLVSRSRIFSCLSRTRIRKKWTTTKEDDDDHAPLRRSSSCIQGNTSMPIMFSNSSGVLKPPSIEKVLECTLEELCFGCIKKINIIRDTFTGNRQVIQVNETLTIEVKPGWSNGTIITFQGMGNEIGAGTYPGDVVFEIQEKRHPVYIREGDDLEMVIEIPLVIALKGCTSIPVHLLGGEKIDLFIRQDEIIRPGHRKILTGQGMPKCKQQEGERGNLIVTFLVQFPHELTREQQSEIVSILED